MWHLYFIILCFYLELKVQFQFRNEEVMAQFAGWNTLIYLWLFSAFKQLFYFKPLPLKYFELNEIKENWKKFLCNFTSLPQKWWWWWWRTKWSGTTISFPSLYCSTILPSNNFLLIISHVKCHCERLQSLYCCFESKIQV